MMLGIIPCRETVATLGVCLTHDYHLLVLVYNEFRSLMVHCPSDGDSRGTHFGEIGLVLLRRDGMTHGVVVLGEVCRHKLVVGILDLREVRLY
jgi:hypothetical protein